MTSESVQPVILYDGLCGLCNRLNQFLLKRDKHDRLRFASLQSDFSRSLLTRHGRNTTDLDTVYLVVDCGRPSERLFERSDAIIEVLSVIGGVWKLMTIAKLLPKFMRDLLYDLIARNRYRVFGKSESCMLPEPRHRAKFLEI
jgi:predicted DCC family thiol-disulfide oxidoreductase YuxK